MRKSMNNLLLIIIMAVFAAAIFFNMGADSKKADKEMKTIKVLWWGTKARHDLTLKVIDMFQKKYPNIKVEPIYTSYDNYFEKLQTLIATNGIPDVLQMDIKSQAPYVNSGIITDLNKISTLDTKDESPSIKAMETINGKLLGVTLGVIAPALVYDKALFQKAGIAAPGPKTTWSDLEIIAKTISQKLKIYGCENIGGENEFEVYVREKGGSFITKDLKKANFSEGTALDFFKMLSRMQENGMEPINIAIESRSNEEDSAYAKGKAAMKFMWTNKIISVFKTKKAISEITVHPGPNNEYGCFIKPGCHFMISEASKAKNEAGLFVNYFVNDIAANKVLNSERGIPAYGKVRKALTMNSLQDGDDQQIKINKYIDFIASFNKRPMDTNFALTESEYRRKYRDIQEAVQFKQLTPEEGAKQLINDINEILEK